MPTTSVAQKHLMQCAAHTQGGCGGVSQSVGKEFVGDDATTSGAGIIFATNTGQVLFLKRSLKSDQPGTWCFPFGVTEGEEEPEETAEREASEEVGDPDFTTPLMPVDRRTVNGVDGSLFIKQVGQPFIPSLNDEHIGYSWAPIDNPPDPLHPAVQQLVAALGQDEAQFKESEHPRDGGQFTSGGGGGSNKHEEGGKAPLAARIKEHAETFKKHGAAAKEWLGGKSAEDVLSAAVKSVANPAVAKKALGLAINTFFYHYGSEGTMFQESVIHDTIEHFATHAQVAQGHARELMQKTVKGLIAARESVRGKMAGDSEDGVDAVLKAILDLLEEPDNKQAQDTALAFDRDSVRNYDADGRLHVLMSHISKAAINEYLGGEIPDYEKLGLDPFKRYKLWRHPGELEKGAPTFNNLPILSQHVPVSAVDHQPDLVVGSTGTDAKFNEPYLDNSLVVWVKDAIDRVEADLQKELSSAYRYRADMTPGTVDGASYDGVMRDIVGNHVALVKDGRAGADVVVGDSMKGIDMSKSVVLTRKAAALQGALLVFLRPKLAMDAKPDLSPALAKVTAKNFRNQRPAIIKDIVALVTPMLAKDASIDTKDISKLLDIVQAVDPMEGMDTDPSSGLPMTKPPGLDALPAFLKEKGMDEESIKKAMDMAGGAKDQDPDDEKKKEGEDEDPDDKDKAKDEFPDKDKKKEGEDEDPDKKPEVTKKAMDAAISRAVRLATDSAAKNHQEIREAERVVRPYVGELVMAYDSAEAVFRGALDALAVEHDDIKEVAALKRILEMQPVPGVKQERTRRIAMDSAPSADFSTRFPETSRIGQV